MALAGGSRRTWCNPAPGGVEDDADSGADDEKSSNIWLETKRRAVSVFGVMSPKPTVEKMETVKYSVECDRGW